MAGISFKSELWNACDYRVREKISLLEKSIQDLQYAVANETKSSSGDKFETAREMAQQEISKLQMQLMDWTKLKLQMGQFKDTKADKTIKSGDLIKCDEFYIYISISLGKIELANEVCWCISPVSPLAQQLLGKEKGHVFQFNGANRVVVEIH